MRRSIKHTGIAKAELEGLKGASGADADFYVAPNGKVLPGSIKTGLVQI